jgi:O-antigen/teichoic acid export membrane protein
VLVAGGITIVSGPISTVLLPRLARLQAEGQIEDLRRLYNQAAQLVSVVAGSIAVVLAVCPEPLLFAWSGSPEMTSATAPVLRLYAIGNGLLALGAFPYYLQYARGDLRYHLWGNLIMVAALIPAIVLAAFHAGGIGAGWVWLGMNALYLLVWVAYVHAKLEPGLHWRWLRDNVLKVLLPTAAVGWTLSQFQPGAQDRWQALAHVVAIGAACILVATLTSPALRPLVTQRIRTSHAIL